jgi:dienelactone hydrolase
MLYRPLSFDKRGNGASTGDYRRATYDDLVADARATFDTLASQAEVDPRRVGLWGISQGAFIAPLVAERRAAFVIAVSSPGMPIAEAAAYQDSLRVAWAGRSHFDAARAAAAHRELAVALRTPNPADAVSALLRRIASEPWRPITALPRTPPPADELRGWYWYGRTLDPVIWWRTLRAPVLLVYGAADELVPAQQSAERLAGALRAGGNKDVTVRVYPRANHVVRLVTSPLAPAGNAWQWPRQAPGYASEVMSWALAGARTSAGGR